MKKNEYKFIFKTKGRLFAKRDSKKINSDDLVLNNLIKRQVNQNSTEEPLHKHTGV
jgi:hypothetical protein